LKNLGIIYKDLISQLKKEFKLSPHIAIILGSGLGDFATQLNLLKSISTSSIAGYPLSTVQGHEGKIHIAKLDDKIVLLFQGRIHFYEGYPIHQCVLPVFISYSLGCRNIILTNAAGGINPNFKPGDLMLATSVNAMYLKNEITALIGIANADMKNNFLNFPSRKLNEVIHSSAIEEKISLKEGTYWFTKGPSYETPSEIKMMAKLGADAVGMSTVHEAVYASALGMDCSCISCITNYAAGISDEKLSHSEVTETANRVKDKFERLLKKIISSI